MNKKFALDDESMSFESWLAPMAKTEKTVKTEKNSVRPSEIVNSSISAEPEQLIANEQSKDSFPHLVFAPIHYEAGYSYPLIVWLHGSGSDEKQLFRIMPRLSLRNYIAVAPRGLTSNESGVMRPLKEYPSGNSVRRLYSTYDWPDNECAYEKIEDRVFGSIERAVHKYNINEHKIVIAGFDVGGTMALRLAAMYPERFAGAVSLCGAFPEENTPLANWKTLRNFPILMSVGCQSRILDSQKVIRQLKLFHAAGMLVSVRQYNVGQELTPQILSDVNNWVMGNIVCAEQTRLIR